MNRAATSHGRPQSPFSQGLPATLPSYANGMRDGPHFAFSSTSGIATSSAVSLDTWSRDLLGEKQLDSIARLSAVMKEVDVGRRTERLRAIEKERALPLRLDEIDGDCNTELPASLDDVLPQNLTLPNAPITSSSALLAWLEGVKSKEVASSNHSEGEGTVLDRDLTHKDALNRIRTASRRSSELLTQLESARINVAELKAGLKSVEETSEELRDESERRGGRAEALVALAQDLEMYLSYFNLLPEATSFLSDPSLSVVLNPRFPVIMEQLDIGLAFILAHPYFKDTSLYRLRFEHCLTRGGTLARMCICNRINGLRDDSLDKLRESEKLLRGKSSTQSEVTEDDLLDLESPILLQTLYSKFAAAAPELSSVLYEIQLRCPAISSMQSASSGKDRQASKLPTDEEALLADYTTEAADLLGGTAPSTATSGKAALPEFETMLNDCRTAFFDSRKTILLPLLKRLLSRIEARAKSTAEKLSISEVSTRPSSVGTGSVAVRALELFIKQSLVILKSVLRSEAELNRAIFGPTDSRSDLSHEFLSSLCRDFRDRLHPRIFAEGKVTYLAALARAVLSASAISESAHAADLTDHYILCSLSDPYNFTTIPMVVTSGKCPQWYKTVLLRVLISPIMVDLVTRSMFRAHAILSGPDVALYSPRAAAGEVCELLITKLSAPTSQSVVSSKMLAALAKKKGRRGRSSLGVGVLEAAAEKAIEESQAEGVSIPGDRVDRDAAGQNGTDGTDSQRVKLFTLPPAAQLATWYPPFSRAFTLLSLVHPVLSRNDFAKVGIETIETLRGILVRLADSAGFIEGVAHRLRSGQTHTDTAGHDGITALTSDMGGHLFLLRHALILQEISASVDLSLMQPSVLDEIETCMRQPTALVHGKTPSTAVGQASGPQVLSAVRDTKSGGLDFGTLLRAVSTIFDVSRSSNSQGLDDHSAGGDTGSDVNSVETAPVSGSPIKTDVQRHISKITDTIASRLLSYGDEADVAQALKALRSHLLKHLDDPIIVDDAILRAAVLKFCTQGFNPSGVDADGVLQAPDAKQKMARLLRLMHDNESSNTATAGELQSSSIS